MMRRIPIAVLLFASTAAAQFFGGGGGDSYKRVTIPYSATPAADLTKGTAFQVTLTGNAALTVTKADKTDGKLVSFLICQDAAGSHAWTWPDNVYGAADMTPLPKWCTAQSFLVLDGYLWAAGAGTESTDVQPPSMLRPPLFGGVYYNQGGLSLSNGTRDVVLSTTSADANEWMGAGYGGIHAFGNRTLDLPACSAGCAPLDVQASFWLDSPDTSKMETVGIYFPAGDTGPGSVAGCQYQYGHSINRYGMTLNAGWPGCGGSGSTQILACGGTNTVNDTHWSNTGNTFTDATHYVTLRLYRDTSGATACTVSEDRGVTWSAPSSYPNLPTTGWLIGANIPATTNKAHLVSFSVIQ